MNQTMRGLSLARNVAGAPLHHRSLQPVRALAARCVPSSSCSPPAQTRHSSHSPLGTAPRDTRKKVTLQTIEALYKRNEPITMLTAHDFPSAHVAEHAGMEIVLVGDSLAMVALGMEDTCEVLVEEMILHCRSVSRGAKTAFIVSVPGPTLASVGSDTARSATCPWDPTRSAPTRPWLPLSGS